MDNPSPNPPPNPVSPPSFIPTVEESPPMPQAPLPDTGGAPILTDPTAFVSTPPSKGTGWNRKVFATVLGLVLLVGGIGAGVILVGQRQIFQPKAACDPTYTCSPDDENVCKGQWFNSHGCTCAGTKDCSGEPATPRPSSNPGTPACPNVPPGNNDGCTVGGNNSCQEDSSGNNTGYDCTCIDLSTGTCTRSVWQCTTYDTNACPNSGAPPAQSFACDGTNPDKVKISGNCLTADNPVYMARYTCPEGTNMTGGCSANPENFTTTNLCADQPSANWCGTVQIDYGQHGTPTGGCSVSRKFPCSSSSPTTKPTTKPTAPPVTPPQCINIKVYDTAWKQLAATDLPKLKVGDKINLAVAGANGTSGSIDKAKFKVNGTDLTETTQKHGTEFYSEYTIPASVTGFTVSVKLHHTTYEWF